MDVAVPFEGDDVGGEAIEEPPIVGDDHDRACEARDPLLEGTERIDVEVVGRFVEEEEVGATPEKLREMDAIAFAAGERPDLLLLVRPLEVELGDVAPRIDRPLAELNRVMPAGDLLEHRLGGIEGIAALVDVADVDGGPDAEDAGIGLLLADEHPEERRLAGAVGPDDADDPPGGEAEGEVFKQHLVAEGLGEPLPLDDQIAERTAGRDEDLHLGVAGGGLFGGQPLVGGDARLALGLPCLRRHPDPLQLLVERFLPDAGLLLLELQAGLLLKQPRRIIPLEGDSPPVVDLEDPFRDVVEEVAVVGHGHDGTGIFREVLLEPVDALGVEMVRWFVEKEHVGAFEEELAQRHAPPLAAGEVGHLPITGREIHRVHRDLHPPVEIPGPAGLDLVLDGGLLREQFFHLFRLHRLPQTGVDCLEPDEDGPRRGDGLHDVLKHRLRRVEPRLLLQIAGRVAVGEAGFPFVLPVDARHDLHERALSGAVAAEEADLRPRIEGDIDVLEQFPLSELLGQVGDLIDEGGAHRKVFCAEGWDRGRAAGRKDRA